MKIAIVGAGRVATALAVAWLADGHEITVASHGRVTKDRHDAFFPDTPLVPAYEAAHAADVVVIGVPDASIEGVCASLAAERVFHEGQVVLHLSGAMGLEVLEAARSKGARQLAVHPLQTFPTVESAIARLTGTPMAVTAEDEETALTGERLARDADGEPFRLDPGSRPLYHAAAVFASNYLVAVTAQAESLFRAAGLPDPVGVFMPLARASLENVATLGPEAALTGPVARGDAVTVRSNLEALAERSPDTVASYVALADIALRLSVSSGRLSEEGRAAVEKVLAEWR
jgi:predicted short-subunit dehydrogenase-like oxidoreductase (DUF2520 family)